MGQTILQFHTAKQMRDNLIEQMLKTEDSNSRLMKILATRIIPSEMPAERGEDEYESTPSISTASRSAEFPGSLA